MKAGRNTGQDLAASSVSRNKAHWAAPPLLLGLLRLIPGWTTENPNCALQHRRSWLAALIPQAITVNNGVVRIASGVRAMKTIVSALVALSVLAGIAGSANALDTKFFWEQQDRQSY